MKKKSLLTTFVLGLLIFLVYVLIVGAVDFFISGSGSYYAYNVIWKNTLNGTTAGDRFGYSVATGDINNDSYADVIVGAYYADPSDASSAGQAYVFFGTADGISDMDIKNANLTFNGTAANDYFGQSVASGDVNNDSYADVIVGAYGVSSSAGQAYVFFGADYPNTVTISYNATEDANLTFNGTIAGDFFGLSVASGDVNGDSYADVIVGAYKADVTGANAEGQVYVFFGADYPSTAGISYDALIDANITVNGTTTNGRFGWSVVSGDVNNDSYADMIGGATWAAPSGSKSGQAYVFFGGVYSNAAPGAVSYNDLIDANITLNGTTGSGYFGGSVALGDVNNDSYADIIVGAYGVSTSAGQAYVFFGADYPDTSGGINYNALIDANITVNGTVAGDQLGLSVASGDVNNDSYVDIIIGANLADPSGTSSGQAYAFFGADYPSTAGISYDALIDANITVNGTAASDQLGQSVASGDVNNDGYADVIVGAYQAPYSDGSAGPGEVYIYGYDDISPVVALDAPADNSYDTDGDVNFSFTAVEVHPDLCTLWFRSNATNWAANDSASYSNNIQTSIFVNLTDAVYVWGLQCNDTANNPAFARSNRTLTVDTTAPTTPTVTEPSDTSINPRDSISYSCESSDVTAGISKWTWTLTKPQSGGTVTKIGGEFTSNTQTFSGDDTNLAGSYTVVCEVEDRAGFKSSSSGSFSVYYSHVSEGAGGAGAGPSAAAQLDFTIQEEMKIKEPQGAIMTFTLDGTTVHTIKLRKVTTRTVTIIIESTPIEITLEIGETKQVDVDGDGVDDISVTLNDIVEGIVDLTTKRLTPLPEKEVPTEEVLPTETPEETTPTAPEAASKAWLLILIIVILAMVAVGYWFMQKKK